MPMSLSTARPSASTSACAATSGASERPPRQGRRRRPTEEATAYVLAASPRAEDTDDGHGRHEGEPLVVAEMRTSIPRASRQRGGDAARSHRVAGAPVPQQRARQSQRRLSPQRRQCRLDRSRSRRAQAARAHQGAREWNRRAHHAAKRDREPTRRSTSASSCRSWRSRAAPLVGARRKTIFDTLLERERLGSTGIGTGTAVPHGRCPASTRIFALFARLEKPIPFEAVDDQPVDLVFCC